MQTYTVLHGDDYQATPAAADGAFTCKMGNVSVFGRRGGYLADRIRGLATEKDWHSFKSALRHLVLAKLGERVMAR